MEPAIFKSRDFLLKRALSSRTGLGNVTINSSPSPSASAVFVANHVFISLDATAPGMRERLDRPFSTIAQGFAAAQDGDTVVILPGSYLQGATPLDLPAVDNLTVEGWGSFDNVRILGTGSALFQTPGLGQDSLVIKDLNLTVLGGGYAFDIGTDTVNRFTQGRLELRNVTTNDTPSRFRRVGFGLIEDSDFGEFIVLGCGDFEVRNTNMGDATFDYLSANAPYSTSVGRLGYRLANVNGGVLGLVGTPAFATDKSTRFSSLAANLTPNAAQEINPSIRYAGTLGGTTGNGNHRETSAQDTGTVAALVSFANQAWEIGGTYTSGIDFSDSTIYGDVSLTFLFNLAGLLDQDDFFFGGEKATILGNITVSAPVPGLEERYLVSFRGSEIGRSQTAVTITTNEANIDLREANWHDNTLSATGGGGFDRSYIVRSASLALANPGGTITINPRFPSYVPTTSLFPIFTPTVGSTATGILANFTDNETITYTTTAAGNAGVAVLRQ